MMTRLAELTEFTVRALMPAATVFLFSLFSLVPVPIDGYGSVAPLLGLSALYCWTVWRPELLPYGALFVIGLTEDALRGLPLGVTALGFIVVAGFVRTQQRALQGRRIELFWVGFVLSALLFGLIGWSAMSLYEGRLMPGASAGIQLLLTLALFPVVAWLLLKLLRRMYPEE